MDNACRNIDCFGIEAYRMKIASCQRQYVFFPARDKQRIAFGGQLFQSETIIFAEISSIQKAYF